MKNSILSLIIEVKNQFIKAWLMLKAPEKTLDTYKDEKPKKTMIFLLTLAIWLSLFTVITNLLGFPCDLLNSGSNPQLFAYWFITPWLVENLGGSFYLWMLIIVFILMTLFVPGISLLYHLVFKTLGSKESYWQTVRFFVYPGVPVMILGWIPYLGGTVIAFWAAAIYPLALHKLHNFSWGKSVAFVGILMGIQIGRIFLTGEWYGIPV